MNYVQNETCILFIEDSKFSLRKPTNDELINYLNQDSVLDKKKAKTKEFTKKTNVINPKDDNIIKMENKLNQMEISMNEFKSKITKDYNKLKEELINSKIRMEILENDLKKIKIKSLFKEIIDFFSYIYNIKIDDSYYNKLSNILNVIDNYSANKNKEEFKCFLLDIYYYLIKGNFLDHIIDTNLNPLDLVFSLIESEKKNYLSKH